MSETINERVEFNEDVELPLAESIPVYQHVEWIDGITPINAENLNKSEEILDYLIGNSGLSHVLLKALRQEIDVRYHTVVQLLEDIDSEATTRANEDIKLSNAIETLDNKHTSTVSSLNKCKEDVEQLKTDLDALEVTVSGEVDKSTTFASNINDIYVRLDNIDTNLTTLTNNINMELNTINSKNYVYEEDELIINCGSSTESIHN